MHTLLSEAFVHDYHFAEVCSGDAWHPQNFRGGVYVTKNGAAELLIQTAEEREAEPVERHQQQQ
jgi:hypothetical protein